jgi:hypothetical protein
VKVTVQSRIRELNGRFIRSIHRVSKLWTEWDNLPCPEYFVRFEKKAMRTSPERK